MAPIWLIMNLLIINKSLQCSYLWSDFNNFSQSYSWEKPLSFNGLYTEHILVSQCMSARQGCPTFFPLEHNWKVLEHKGLKPKASPRREAPKGWGRGSPPPADGGPGGLPREIFGKSPQNGAFWCILKQ